MKDVAHGRTMSCGRMVEHGREDNEAWGGSAPLGRCNVCVIKPSSLTSCIDKRCQLVESFANALCVTPMNIAAAGSRWALHKAADEHYTRQQMSITQGSDEHYTRQQMSITQGSRWALHKAADEHYTRQQMSITQGSDEHYTRLRWALHKAQMSITQGSHQHYTR